MGVKPEFVRGGTSGINATALKDGQLLFNKDTKKISLDMSVNGVLTRVDMSGDNTFNGTSDEWALLTDAQKANFKYVYLTDDYEVISQEFTGATASTDGSIGLVPQPVAGEQNKVLFGDADWKELADVALSGAYADLENKPTLGTAAAKDVASSGDASSTEVVMGNDSRLTDARDAADVYSWAKAETKPTYTASEVGLGNVGNFKAVSTEASQELTDTEKLNARTNIGAGTSSFDGAYSSLTGTPTLGTASEKNVAATGDAAITEVVMGNDSRLTNSRNAADVYSWAKAETKPTYTASEVGAYTTAQVDNLISALETNIDWKEAVATYSDIATTYPNPQDGWTVNVKDTDYTYRYNGTAWVAISANAIPEATTSVNGLMTTTQVTKLDGIASGAEVNVQADWSVTDDTSDAFIKNKPTIPTVTGKADKVSGATSGNFASLDSNGNLADSGHKHSDYLTSHQDITGKADKVTSATNGNFAGLDSNGNLTDSGKKASDFQSKPTVYSESLTAGNTSVAFTGVSTTANSKIDIATSQAGLDYNSLSVSGTTYTVTYDAQSSAVTVYLIVTEVS